eukprot:365747-Chlamydomonas_euryale.AAC.18
MQPCSPAGSDNSRRHSAQWCPECLPKSCQKGRSDKQDDRNDNADGQVVGVHERAVVGAVLARPVVERASCVGDGIQDCRQRERKGIPVRGPAACLVDLHYGRRRCILTTVRSCSFW